MAKMLRIEKCSECRHYLRSTSQEYQNACGITRDESGLVPRNIDVCVDWFYPDWCPLNDVVD